MRYKDFEGTIEELVNIKLEEIEKAENVKILHAIESGSRAWGFASPDSDYDVRFIYVRPKEYYLRLDDKKDVIDWELNEILDINGWDLSKALRLFHNSNATLFEWANSPVVYRATKAWVEINKTVEQYFAEKSTMYHYYGMANSNFQEYLQGECVKYKKYFYVIRPLLACKWIDEKKCPPPVFFETLKNTMLDDIMKREINQLQEQKVRMSESDKGPRIDVIHKYIEDNLQYYKEIIPSKEDNRKAEWDTLNQVFIKNII
jgi:predicted nucleotidyltransferase